VGNTTVNATIVGRDFTCSVPIAEGANDLEVLAEDRTAHNKAVTRRINLDTTAPTIEIRQPGEDDYTSAHQIDVSGTVLDPGALPDAPPLKVRVEGISALVDGNLFVAHNVPVGEPPTVTLRAVVEDAAKNTGEDAVTVKVDRRAPVVEITIPRDGDYVKGPEIGVAGTVSDESPIVQFEVNGQPVPLADGAFDGKVLAPDGPLTLTALAVDAAANPGSDTVRVTVDSLPPVIVVDEPPLDGSLTRDEAVRVAGRVTDASPGTLRIGTVVIDFPAGGAPVSVDVPLPGEGPNPIPLEATDKAGNRGSLTVTVTVDRTGPDLSIEVPKQDAVLTSLR
jgi:hypothetical protein